MKKTLTKNLRKGFKHRGIRSWLEVEITTESGYFSITGKMGDVKDGRPRPAYAFGYLHDEISTVFPELKPLIALHLSDAETGEPLHAAANGFYWFAGTFVDGLGEEYHGGTGNNSKTISECKETLAKYFRVPLESVENLRQELLAKNPKLDALHTRVWWHDKVETLRPQWKKDAEKGRALIIKIK